MSRTRKSLTFAAVTAALAAGVLAPATSASAADAPAFLGEPKEWGMVAIDLRDVSLVKPLTIKTVGGGTWSYGTQVNGSQKRCYSNYDHQTKYHSSTVILASSTRKDYAEAGDTSNASLTNGSSHTCYAYWGTY
ncbi:lactococcin 972 family bacteriocin [Streptomyces ossamyceticus]|jgi:lactococcin 972 family bacteriocin|uniref:lactococcin 972 family bacteriocin n=1 Tax=Streptomyces ossamyceticus TaxID=249581 RepID=UPI0034210150